MTEHVRDARPPMALVKLLNPIMRLVLRSPVGRLVKPFALLEFRGRRSGRMYLVPTGLYRVNGVMVVFSPADWRANFAGGEPATVHHLGRASSMTGTLITDPCEVAKGLVSVLANGSSARLLGIGLPTDHQINATDVVTLDRAMIEFHSTD